MGKQERMPIGRPALRVGDQVIPLPENYPIHWPAPEPGQGFADVVQAIPIVEEMYEEVAHAQVLELLNQGVPDWLDAADLRHASSVLLELCRENPDASSPLELLWTLAADAFRPKPLGGRPATRSGQFGAELYELVEIGLSAMRVKRDRKKGVRAVIAVLRQNDPSGYGTLPEERLRKAYYGARRARGSVRKPR